MQFFTNYQSYYLNNIEYAVETESHEEQSKIALKLLNCTSMYTNISDLKSDVKHKPSTDIANLKFSTPEQELFGYIRKQITKMRTKL